MPVIAQLKAWRPYRRRSLGSLLKARRSGYIYTPGAGCEGASCHCSSLPSVVCSRCTSNAGPPNWKVVLANLTSGHANCPTLNATFYVPHLAGCEWRLTISPRMGPFCTIVFGLHLLDEIIVRIVESAGLGSAHRIEVLLRETGGSAHTIMTFAKTYTTSPIDCLTLDDSIPYISASTCAGSPICNAAAATCQLTADFS